jgi:AbrB family looped-hinge helix DNA binding protein
METLITTVTTKGQVVIPAPLRKKLHLQRGVKLGVSEQDGRIILTVLGEDAIRAGRGMLTTRGTVLKQLVEDRLIESRR